MINTTNREYGISAALLPEDSAYIKELLSQETSSGAIKDATTSNREQFVQRHLEKMKIAVFLNEFNPKQLFGNLSEDEFSILVSFSTISVRMHESRWQLNKQIRSEMIGMVCRNRADMQNCIARTIDYLWQIDGEIAPITNAFKNLIESTALTRSDIAAAGQRMWAAYRMMYSILENADFPGQKVLSELMLNVEYAELLDQFRFLTGWNPETKQDKFVGRKKELEKLRSFVDLLRSQGIGESIKRISSRYMSEMEPMVLSGVGGIGKSTLIAKFLLQHVESISDGAPFYFAYLDFDRSTISPVQPVSLLIEIIKQLRWQFTENSERFNSLLSRLQKEIAYGDRSRLKGRYGNNNQNMETTVTTLDSYLLPNELLDKRQLWNYVDELTHYFKHISNMGRILLVLDTFEEVQALGDTAVTRVEELLYMLPEMNPMWRILIVGRDSVENFFHGASRTVLDEFTDSSSREAFLRGHGIDKVTAQLIAKQVGGRPLALQLAARLVNDHGLDAIKYSLGERIGSFFDRTLIEGILYQRILDHIPDKDVRQIAHPGLVLRRLDAEIIEKILVPTLGLGKVDGEKITRVLEILGRQKDLVRVEDDGTITHRTDVREQMLALMTKDSPELVERIHRAAVDYYIFKQKNSAQQSLARNQIQRAEELYHRLQANVDLDKIVVRWTSDVRVKLGRDVEEIQNPIGKLALKVMLGRSVSFDEARTLTPGLITRFSVQKIEQALKEQMPEMAMEVFNQFVSYIPHDFSEFFLPVTVDQVGKPKVVIDSFKGLITSRRMHDLGDVLQVMDFFERVDIETEERQQITTELLSLKPAIRGEESEIAILLAQMRLQIRLKLAIGEESESQSNEYIHSLLRTRIIEQPSNDALWLLSLTWGNGNEYLSLFRRMPITKLNINKLRFLERSIRMKNGPFIEDGLRVLDVCNTFLQARNFNTDFSDQGESKEQIHTKAMVIRHIMRPTTPQWYIPLAAVIRKNFDGVVDSYIFRDGNLPDLHHIILEKKLTTTKSLAELLGQLDQYGLLQVILEKLAWESSLKKNEDFAYIFRAYKKWRMDFFQSLDNWFVDLALNYNWPN